MEEKEKKTGGSLVCVDDGRIVVDTDAENILKVKKELGESFRALLKKDLERAGEDVTVGSLAKKYGTTRQNMEQYLKAMGVKIVNVKQVRYEDKD